MKCVVSQLISVPPNKLQSDIFRNCLSNLENNCGIHHSIIHFKQTYLAGRCAIATIVLPCRCTPTLPTLVDAHYYKRTPTRHFITFKHHCLSTFHLPPPQFYSFIISLTEGQNCNFLRTELVFFKFLGYLKKAWRCRKKLSTLKGLIQTPS